MTPGHVYSQAPRCTECDARALLAEEAATALVEESLGRLTARRCPREEGWHIYDPVTETR